MIDGIVLVLSAMSYSDVLMLNTNNITEDPYHIRTSAHSMIIVSQDKRKTIL